jgi:hypothetical protein
MGASTFIANALLLSLTPSFDDVVRVLPFSRVSQCLSMLARVNRTGDAANVYSVKVAEIGRSAWVRSRAEFLAFAGLIR